MAKPLVINFTLARIKASLSWPKVGADVKDSNTDVAKVGTWQYLPIENHRQVFEIFFSLDS